MYEEEEEEEEEEKDEEQYRALECPTLCIHVDAGSLYSQTELLVLQVAWLLEQESHACLW